MTSGIQTLRRLANEVSEIAHMDRYLDNVALHRAVNDKRMVRPVVLIDELPWHEMDFDGSLAPICEDPVLRDAETYLRRVLFRHRHFPADMLVKPYYPLRKVIVESGIGVTVNEKTLSTDAANHIIAHEYHDQLADEASLGSLHPPVVEYDRRETMRRLEIVADAFGDILPVRLTGVDSFYTPVWDNISRYRGVTALLMDLAERPEYTHRMVDLLTSFEEARLLQYEELSLLDAEQNTLHCTCQTVSDLPGENFDAARVTRKNIWGRGMAQIFASVSPAMHEEFDIAYMRRTIGTCGLAYYGCCEPLDTKMGVVEKIPNLRKVGLTPWADARALCGAVAGRFVVSAKPNPAAVAVPALNEDHLRKELLTIVGACKDTGCSVDIVLKDISTCLRRPQNIFQWEKTAMRVVEGW